MEELNSVLRYFPNHIKENILQNIILSKIGKNKKIYARKCDIKIVSNKDANEFISSMATLYTVSSESKKSSGFT